MRVFFGAAIQGLGKRGERSPVYSAIIAAIKEAGHTVLTEHTVSDSMAETARLLEESIGPLPPPGPERRVYVRNKMIDLVESDIAAAIFEVSTPSLGTGIEIAHAYLRPRMSLSTIPVLALYETGYWPNDLSSMIKGITPAAVPHFSTLEFDSPETAKEHVRLFLRKLAVD